MTKYGRQPAADLIKRQGLTRPQVAEAIGVPLTVLNNILAGAQVPPDEVRLGLARVLGVGLDELFTAEPLARKVGRRYRWGVLVSETDDENEIRVQQPTKRRGYWDGSHSSHSAARVDESAHDSGNRRVSDSQASGHADDSRGASSSGMPTFRSA